MSHHPVGPSGLTNMNACWSCSSTTMDQATYHFFCCAEPVLSYSLVTRSCDETASRHVIGAPRRVAHRSQPHATSNCLLIFFALPRSMLFEWFDSLAGCSRSISERPIFMPNSTYPHNSVTAATAATAAATSATTDNSRNDDHF